MTSVTTAKRRRRRCANGKIPSRIESRSVENEEKRNKGIDRKGDIPARTMTVIAAAAIVKTTIAARIESANVPRNTGAATEAEEMTAIVPVTTTTTTLVRGATRVTAKLIGKRDGNGKKMYARSVESEKKGNAGATTIIRLRRHRMTIPMILRTIRNESIGKIKRRKRRRKAATLKNAGVLFRGKKLKCTSKRQKRI
jgi:hypothetical protein